MAVSNVQFLLDGAALGAPVTQAPYSINWDSTATVNGSHTLSARATDTSGNSAVSSAVSVTVSNAAPTGIVVDTTVAKDGKGPLSVSVSTAAAGELLLAFVGSDGVGAQTVTVSGAGLTWTLVKRTNAQNGDSEIWSARATAQLSAASVTATQSITGYNEIAHGGCVPGRRRDRRGGGSERILWRADGLPHHDQGVFVGVWRR